MTIDKTDIIIDVVDNKPAQNKAWRERACATLNNKGREGRF